MKKITFVLFALIAGTAFAQDDATASAAVSADVVSPITLVKSVDLNFGKVANTGGTVVITTAGHDAAASTTAQIGATSPTAAAFTVNAALGYGYSVTLPAENTINLTNQTGTVGETMVVSSLADNSDNVGDGADETFQVGGTLTVGASQVVGTYTGTLPVTVAYE